MKTDEGPAGVVTEGRGTRRASLLGVALEAGAGPERDLWALREEDVVWRWEEWSLELRASKRSSTYSLIRVPWIKEPGGHLGEYDKVEPHL